MGYFVLKHHFTKSKNNIIFALIVPSLVHYIYNFTVLNGNFFILIIIVLLLIIIPSIILHRVKKKQGKN